MPDLDDGSDTGRVNEGHSTTVYDHDLNCTVLQIRVSPELLSPCTLFDDTFPELVLVQEEEGRGELQDLNSG